MRRRSGRGTLLSSKTQRVAVWRATRCEAFMVTEPPRGVNTLEEVFFLLPRQKSETTQKPLSEAASRVDDRI